MFHCRSERGEPVPILEVSSVREWSIGEEPRSTDTSNPIRIIERRILLRQRMSCEEHLYGSEETMPDDLNKRGAQDRARVSKQEHEQRYQKRKRSSSSTRSRSKSSRRKKS